MTYEIFLTQATDESKVELARHYELCKCCGFENVIWLSAINVNGKITIHGDGYFDNGGLELPIKDPTPEMVCRFYVADALAHGHTVIFTSDVDEFIRLVNKYLK